MINDSILTVYGVAQKLDCAPRQAEKLLKSGEIRATRDTGKYLTLESEVVAYVRQRIETTSPTR